MDIIPAIDLRQGKCVRLYQGDYDAETIFSEDPVSMARHWQSLGARRLHIVDLDGAAEGEPCNDSVVGEIVSQVNIPVQVGGGIRTMESVKRFLDLGVDRVILGTVAIESPELVKEACQAFDDRIVVSIDARDGYVKGRGWKRGSDLTTGEVIQQMESCGVGRFIYTDISRDGTLTEPNFVEIKRFVLQTTKPVIAAGGIASVRHLTKLAGLGVEGAIVGRAVYTQDIDLKQALAAIENLNYKKEEHT
ncbi:MAG: 1-(5-phosphoribosyl)-5-[(5-phosphoribosylamino)methylideneamino]imidazole-4-carboxamide isomerase [Chloroflexota bacterium]